MSSGILIAAFFAQISEFIALDLGFGATDLMK